MNIFADDTVIDENTTVDGGSIDQPAQPKQAKAGSAPLPEANFSYTVKDPHGGMLTIRGATADELSDQVTSTLQSGLLKALADLATKVAGTKSSIVISSPPQIPQPVASPWQGQGNYQPAAPVAVVAPQLKNHFNCEHGPLVYQEWGKNKFDKPFQAWKCPLVVQTKQRTAGCGDQVTYWLSQAKKDGNLA